MKKYFGIVFFLVSITCHADTQVLKSGILYDKQELDSELLTQIQRDLEYLEDNNEILVKPYKTMEILCPGLQEELSAEACLALKNTLAGASQLVVSR